MEINNKSEMYNYLLKMQSLIQKSIKSDVEEQKIYELLREYAEIRLESLKPVIEDFLKQHYQKDYSLEYRAKTVEKMMAKAELWRQRGKSFIPTKMPDIIGFRIAVDNESDVVELSNIIEQELNPISKTDYFTKPVRTGFKAYLYYLATDFLNVEIQVMTKEMALFANRTHDEYDLNMYGIKK